jgi:hypothetical protein
LAGGTFSLIEQDYREMLDLQQALGKAKEMKRGTGERALRQRAERVRVVIQRIECVFTAT